MNNETIEKLYDIESLEKVEDKSTFLYELADSILMTEAKYNNEEATALVYALAYLAKSVTMEFDEASKMSDEDSQYLAAVKQAYKITREGLSTTMEMRQQLAREMDETSSTAYDQFRQIMDSQVSTSFPAPKPAIDPGLSKELDELNKRLAEINAQQGA